MKTIKLSDYKGNVAKDFVAEIRQNQYGAVLADPPWRFQNRTGKMAPEHKRLSRYPTLSLDEIKEIPVHLVAAKNGGIGFLSEPMAVYRIHNNSYWSSRNKIDMLKGSIKNCKQLINHVLIEQTYKKKTHKYFIHLHNQLFKELLNHHKFVESIYILIKLFLIQSIDLNLIRKTKDRIFAIFQKIFITGVNRLIF